jgi:hypothetical protein
MCSFLNNFFLKAHQGDELSPPEYSFHGCRTGREVEGRGANPNTIGAEKYSGKREITTPTTITPTTPTLKETQE